MITSPLQCSPFLMRQEEGDGSKKTEMIVRSSLQDILNIQANTIAEQMFWGFAMIVTACRGKKSCL